MLAVQHCNSGKSSTLHFTSTSQKDLTHRPQFDYKKIGEACGISAGAASKRMSRLKQAVKSGKESGLDVRYLWSCIQNSDIKDVSFHFATFLPQMNATRAD